MTSFQIAVSFCLLAFFMVTGCNDLTSQSKSQTTAIIKEVQDADAEMSAKSEQPAGVSTTVEIIKKESEQMSGAEDGAATSEAAATDSSAASGEAEANKVEDSEKTADKLSKMESNVTPAGTVTQ